MMVQVSSELGYLTKVWEEETGNRIEHPMDAPEVQQMLAHARAKAKAIPKKHRDKLKDHGGSLAIHWLNQKRKAA